ncbi:zinc-dependent metalloprotease [Ornithinimicrobium faecis]|uniref:Zinc-dependent metalloprotease n=1 Tax=Ornithinimicrobium faecis TaxID=2934158 RepID=A0ABY4YS55_9MICO|nr:zinc-dependent metalloprotease [Ornithinimicrobium sp. HY1793]USQ79601.1 zinc-dependent metalloprotease [Ornithinimicrobium sp. HY1793]
MTDLQRADRGTTSEPAGGGATAGASANAGADATAGAGYVDWDFAASAGRRLAPPGPKAGRAQIERLVAELRDATERAVEPVAHTSGLRAPEEAPTPLVVDRGGWIEANTASLRGMLGPVLDHVVTRRKDNQPSETAQRFGGRMTGTEVAGMLAWMSTKVLGQYDLAPEGTPRLLLVAPNILAVERDLGVDPADFRLWVCLHEETHRVQFTAVPWLRQHIVDAARELGTELVPESDQMSQRLQEIVTALPGVLRGESDITQVLATPEQRERLAEVTAVMSLLEGHADVIMDDVGPSVIPSVATIRARFQERRKGSGGVDRILRRLLGMDAKMAQYRDGAVFVRSVTDQVGRDGFNRVWESPETLPRAAEIADPAAWVRRVHG